MVPKQHYSQSYWSRVSGGLTVHMFLLIVHAARFYQVDTCSAVSNSYSETPSNWMPKLVNPALPELSVLCFLAACSYFPLWR